MNKRFVPFIAVLVLLCCKKNDPVCKSYTGIQPGFDAYEYVLDTLLKTDTGFTDTDIFFKTKEYYSNATWTIGNDPRTFNNQAVNLRFTNPEVLNITLKGNAVNSSCVPESFNVIQPFVLLANNGQTQSPLVGRYKGYNTDNASDTFTIEIKFWFGSRYNWWSNGAYSVENLPKGYTDTTQNFNGYARPEIRGIIASTGYKNIAIEKSGNLPALGIKGYGSVYRGVRDTLRFNYTVIDTAQLNSNGAIKYLQRKFIGIKN